MKSFSVVYAVFVPPCRQRRIIDAIRLFAHPRAKHTAHITVRGPYLGYQDPRPWSAEVAGRPIDVEGVGTFFNGGQNTVFLSADAPALRAVWHKPDYPDDYCPHLTVYDGPSRDFAEAVRDVLDARHLRFRFIAGGLEPIVLGNGARPLRTMYDPLDFTGLMESPPSLAEIDSASGDTRLAWIAELAESFSSAACQMQ